MKAWQTKEDCVHVNLSILYTIVTLESGGIIDISILFPPRYVVEVILRESRISPFSNPIYYGSTFVQNRHLTREIAARLWTRRTR